MVVARGEPRLATLMQLVGDETCQSRPGRELVLERLLEVLLIEALRCSRDPDERLLRRGNELLDALRRVIFAVCAPNTMRFLSVFPRKVVGVNKRGNVRRSSRNLP
jgi:hypothetical protein